LTPNDEKSLVHTRARYERWVDRPAEVKRQITDNLGVDLDAWILEPPTGYGEAAEEEPTPEAQALAAEHEGQVAGAVRTLEVWREHVRSPEASDPLERYVFRVLARDAIRVLRRRLSGEGVPFCEELLAYEPQMTHTICRYLSRLTSVSDDPVNFVAEIVIGEETHLSVWQRLWLLEPLLWGSSVPAEVWPWVRGMLRQPSSALRGRAALALATHDQISATTIGLIFEESAAAAKPDLAVAMVRAAGGNSKAIESVGGESQLLRLVAAAASTA
jgi:hypothetical protein